ncbi:hypothetical protein PV327_006112 [Microctonus hyperodae]|uniref:Succinate dehydrogenase assembly factor 3 n=1 Tax=Microctonus hyperodae TaxID=165561 RepID=A0AA39L0E7_MICHY|nr:hypothetical protein PV327_006112 [Microctonus hyperodae]
MNSPSHIQRVRILYKTILKLHRGLPAEMQSLGNNYVRDEFRRHKNCNSSQTDIFMNEWVQYTLSLAEQLGLHGPVDAENKLGKNLRKEDLQQLRDEQIYQLYELMLASSGKPSQV